MVNENAIKAFFDKIAENTDFATKITQTVDPEQVIAIADGNGIELTIEDVMASKDILNELFDRQNNGELSEEELENVAGGIVITASATALVVCAGIAAVATLGGAALGGAGTILGAVISAKGWKW